MKTTLSAIFVIMLGMFMISLGVREYRKESQESISCTAYSVGIDKGEYFIHSWEYKASGACDPDYSKESAEKEMAQRIEWEKRDKDIKKKYCAEKSVNYMTQDEFRECELLTSNDK